MMTMNEVSNMIDADANWSSVDTSVETNPLVVDSGLGDGSTVELLEPVSVKAVEIGGNTLSVLMDSDKVQPREQSDDVLLLTGNDRMKGEGSWVFSSQGVAAEQGFRNVSQLWYPKTLSFEDGLEIVGKQKAMREDITFDVRNTRCFVDENGLTIDVDGRQFKPTDWAARQFCNWLNVPQTMWVAYAGGDNGDLELLANAFDNGRRKYDKEKKLLFRTYKDGTLRGVMSDSYSIVDNDWYLEMLQEFIPGGRLSHFHFSDPDNFYGNILIPDTIRSEDDSDYGAMLNCGNSAVGKRSVWQTPSIFRAICMNGCVWGAKDGIELRRRHRGIDLKEYREACRLNIEKQIPLATTKIPELISLHSLKLSAPMVKVFTLLAKGSNLPSAVLNSVAECWMKDCGIEKTAFGVVDAFTRAGQKFSSDIWETCDIIGGNILNGGSEAWITLNMKATLVSDAEVTKAFGNAE